MQGDAPMPADSLTFSSWENAADLDNRLNSPLAAIYRRHINQQWDAILAVFYCVCVCVWGGGGITYINTYIHTYTYTYTYTHTHL